MKLVAINEKTYSKLLDKKAAEMKRRQRNVSLSDAIDACLEENNAHCRTDC